MGDVSRTPAIVIRNDMMSKFNGRSILLATRIYMSFCVLVNKSLRHRIRLTLDGRYKYLGET